MDEIAQLDIEEEEKKDPGHLFKQLMASINPFSSFVLDECKNKCTTKEWTLEEPLF